MSRFIRTLVKVGLVELDPAEQTRLEQAAKAESSAKPEAKAAAGASAADDVDQLLKDTEALLASTGPAKAAPRAAAPPPPPPPAPKAAPTWNPQPSARATPKAAPAGDAPTGVAEGRPLAEIYAAAGVPASPYPAEKLLRLIEGLKAMDPAMRKAAILAMDAADDAWTLEDPLGDAQRKIAALEGAKATLGATVGKAEARVEAELRAADAYQKEATEKIRAQIAELESLLEQELTTVANQRSEAQARAQSTREAAAREAARLDQEIAGLSTILNALKN